MTISSLTKRTTCICYPKENGSKYLIPKQQLYLKFFASSWEVKSSGI